MSGGGIVGSVAGGDVGSGSVAGGAVGSGSVAGGEVGSGAGVDSGAGSVATGSVGSVGSVADTGPGFDRGAAADGVGLRNMEDRIGAVGGALQIDGSGGTTVGFTIPVA